MYPKYVDIIRVGHLKQIEPGVSFINIFTLKTLSGQRDVPDWLMSCRMSRTFQQVVRSPSFIGCG